MDTFLSISLLSLAMFIGCFLAGIIPLAISLTESKLRLITVLGSGLLVGTALAVIIPEGVHALYSNREVVVHKTELKWDHDVDIGIINNNNINDLNDQRESPEQHEKPPDEVEKAVELQLLLKNEQQQLMSDEHTHTHTHNDESHIHSVIGIALVLGFVFMLLIDQIDIGGHNHQPDLDVGSTGKSGGKVTATLGLVVHAAADGIAMGAAASMARMDVEMIVFFAIMLHKAPAAFGLTTFLLHDGLGRNAIRKHLLIFSLAAPLLTIITYLCLRMSDQDLLENVNATGLAMLFSAGTFLYVATVHVLPEIQNSNSNNKLTKIELFSLICGTMMPVLLTIGHEH